ncbi:MAG: hypothetical protein HY876_07625 [Coriobacteriales bacterium]|nr:hypothetical protein [Coriobacteriales bacterium]
MEEAPTPQSHIEIMAALASQGIDAELTPEPVAWMGEIPVIIQPIEGIEALRLVTWSDADPEQLPLEQAVVINNKRTADGTLARSYALDLTDQGGGIRLMFDYIWVYGPSSFTPEGLVYALRLFHGALVTDFGLTPAPSVDSAN